jgi:hypothetical protein
MENNAIQDIRTYRGMQMSSIVFFNLVWDNTHTLEDLTKTSQDLVLKKLLCWHQSGGVFSTRVLEAISLPCLKGLNSMANVAGNDPKASQTFLLQDLDHLQ